MPTPTDTEPDRDAAPAPDGDAEAVDELVVEFDDDELRRLVSQIEDDVKAEIRQRESGYAPGEFSGVGTDYRVGVETGSDMMAILGDAAAEAIVAHDEQFADIDPADIEVLSVHLQPDAASYIEFFIL